MPQLTRAVLVLLALGGSSSARGQAITPEDTQQAARFDAAVQAARRGGFEQPIVVGDGEGDQAPLVVLLATRAGQGRLLVVDLSAGLAPTEIERGNSPAALGIRRISLGPFPAAPDLVDVVVRHEPFMLETSRSFETHHILRRASSGPTAVCEFDGDATSTSSKGVGSTRSTRRVTVEVRSEGARATFVVTTVDETVRQSGTTAPATTDRSEAQRAFELPATGVCIAR